MTPFLQAYLVCALWSSTDDGDEPMDSWATVDDIAPELLASSAEDCAAFLAANESDLRAYLGRGDWESHGGHDFWLTRNGHGAGYWDGDYPDDEGRRLTDNAHVYGSVDLYVGDDGRIHGQ